MHHSFSGAALNAVAACCSSQLFGIVMLLVLLDASWLVIMHVTVSQTVDVTTIAKLKGNVLHLPLQANSDHIYYCKHIRKKTLRTRTCLGPCCRCK